MAARIYLLGRTLLEAGGAVWDPATFPGRQGRVVFTVLAWDRQRWSRTAMADILWPEEVPEAWEGALSAIVSKLRRLLAQAGLDGVLEGGDGAYELRLPEGTWVDVRGAVNALDRAEGLVRVGRMEQAWSEATVASAILRRPLLPGEELPWVEARRRELADLELRTLDCLCRVWLGRSEPTLAIRTARRLVELAPYRESAYARLMEGHLAAGNAAEAVRVYTELSRLLADELGISPSPEVQGLYERALGGA